jgi:ABC-type thiamine transport system ATPase subunit
MLFCPQSKVVAVRSSGIDSRQPTPRHLSILTDDKNLFGNSQICLNSINTYTGSK